MVALLALIVGGWWRLPLTGASGGAAAVCRAAASAAAAGTRFHRSYGLAGSNETIRTVLPTSDGGFLLVGQVGKVDQTSSLYPYVVKVDAAGNVQWSRTYGDGNKWTGGAVAAADGGFWLAGSTAQGDIYLVKMDADGNVQRAITYDGGAFERAGTILATSDGGFLLVGSTSPGYPSPAQPLVVKLDGSGRVQWSRTYTLSSSIVQTFLFSVVQTADGGFLVGGDRSIYDYRTDQTTYSIVLLKLNADGTVQQGWELTNPSSGSVLPGDMVTTADGGVLLVGTTVVGVNSQNLKDNDILAVKLDSAGNVQWSRTYGRPGVLDEAGTAVVRTPDGGFLLAGNTHNSSSGFDAYAVRIDGAGSVQWSRTYDGGGGEGIRTAVMAADGGFLLAGDTWPDPTAYDDMYVVRTDAVGESDCNTVPVVTGTTTPTIDVSAFLPDSSPVPLTAGTLAFSSTVPATQSESRCRYRLYLPLVVRGP